MNRKTETQRLYVYCPVYIPEKDNLIFSRLMDAGKLLTGKIRKIQQKGSFTQISIGICLVDF